MKFKIYSTAFEIILLQLDLKMIYIHKYVILKNMCNLIINIPIYTLYKQLSI